MADYNQVIQLLHRWCAAHDSHDLEAMSQLVTSDVEMFRQTNREAALDRLRVSYASMTQLRRHVITNTVILEDSDEEALTQSYILHFLIKDDKVWLNYTGTYRFLSVLQNGRWLVRRWEDFPDTTYSTGDADDRPAAGVLQSTKAF